MNINRKILVIWILSTKLGKFHEIEILLLLLLLLIDLTIIVVVAY